MNDGRRAADTRRRELLALALADDTGVDAWLRWASANPVEEMSSPETHLLPFIASRFAGEPDREGLAKLRGVARYWWTRNVTLLRSVSRIGQVLDRKAVPWAASGECAVACLHAEGLVRRPLTRVTLEIAPRGAAAAIRAACQEGWNVRGSAIVRFRDPLQFAELRSSDGNVLRLIWRRTPEGAGTTRANDLNLARPDRLLNELLENSGGWSQEFPELWEIDLALLLLGPLAGVELENALAGTRVAPEANDRITRLRAILRKGALDERLEILQRALSSPRTGRLARQGPSLRGAIAYLRARWGSAGAAGFLATLARKLVRRVRMG